MKKIAVLIVLLTSFFLTAMSDSPKEEPKQSNSVGFQSVNNKITDDELHNIAVNYYKFIFEEEHEWKEIRVDSSKSVIKNITPLKDGDITLAYIVNYNPRGYAFISAYKSLYGPIHRTGGGNDTYKNGVEEGFLSIHDKRIHHPTQSGYYERLSQALKEGKVLSEEKDFKSWERYNKPPEEFKEKADFSKEYHPPKWWLEKKNSWKSNKSIKNTLGLLQTEWNQDPPYNNFCQSGTAVVGCTPLAIAQLTKFYSYPSVGLENLSGSSYDWANMPAYATTSSPPIEQNAVALICGDGGIATNAVYYGMDSTTAKFSSISPALTAKFNYTAQLNSRASNYATLAIWTDSLKTSITRNQPVIYGGKYLGSNHTWIIDDYSSVRDEFHFNEGQIDTTANDWYSTSNILWSDAAVFNIKPDKNETALTIPYKEDFENTEEYQIPKNTGVSRVTNINNSVYNPFFVLEMTSKELWSTNLVDLSDWFVIKKINLACDSVPVLKFKYAIHESSGLSPDDSLIIQVSDNNRVSWSDKYILDASNYNEAEYTGTRIISLSEYKNDIVNIRFKCTHKYSDPSVRYAFDDIEVGKLLLSFPELTNDMTLSPKTAQSVKVTPSIATSPKYKGFEDYDMIMDFYIKKDDGTSQYALAFTDSVLENGVFEYPNWNTDDSLGVTFKIRAVSRAKSSLTTLTSSEVRVKISGRECHVDLPLPASETWFDFETRLNFAGSILAEAAFVDSLDNVLIGFDVYDDYASELNGFPVSIFHPQYVEYYGCQGDSVAYFCEFEKKSPQRSIIRKDLSSNDKEEFKLSATKKIINLSTGKEILNDAKNLVAYPAFTYRYPNSLDLYPGSYTVYMQAIRKDLYEADYTISEIAKADSMQFIIPQWKMKLRRDYWFANTVVPYKQNLEYEAGKIMQIIFWRPFFLGPYEPLYLNIERETDHTVVQNYEVDFNTKASYDLIEWTIPSETVPGFYNLKASNLDYWTNIPVNEQIDPQICPLYLSWENTGNWPENWPGSDTADWEIHAGAAWTPAMGAYSLGAKYSTEGNTGLLSIQKSISVDSEWESVLEFAIGVEKEVGTLNFDPLLADYSLATSKDGANWTIEKTAVLSDYTSLSWSLEAGHCLVKYFKPLGDISNLGVKFIKNGIVTSPPDSQVTLFDEVKVVLTKTPLKTGPTNPSAQYAGGNVSVGWSGAVKDNKALDNYYIYRNGNKIGETTAVTYVDSTVSANTFYNYSITAHYDDGSTYPESPMNECSVSIYTGLYSPSNLVITNENPNIKLTWSSVSGASEYKVYSSNDPYGTFAEDASGTFSGEEWTAPINTSRLFYYVVAVNESMKEKKIKEESLSRVK
jgi:hypothetical protein